jgi:hypothetical protein
LQVAQDLKAKKVILVRKVRQVLQDVMEFLQVAEEVGHKVPRAFKEFKVNVAHKEKKVKKEIQVQVAAATHALGCKAHKGFKVNEARKEFKANEAFKVFRANEAFKVFRVKRVTWEMQDEMD